MLGGQGEKREVKGHEPRIISWPGAQGGRGLLKDRQAARTPHPQRRNDSSFSSTWTKSWRSLGVWQGEERERGCREFPSPLRPPPTSTPMQMTKGGEDTRVSDVKAGHPGSKQFLPHWLTPCPLRLSCWAGAGWCQGRVPSAQSGAAQGPEM